jgi:hypothetical protein
MAELLLEELEAEQATPTESAEEITSTPGASDLEEFVNSIPEVKEEVKEVKEEQKEEAPKFQAYTEDEFNEILDNDGKFDAKRLTPAQKVIQKSFERHYQKKYQEVAELKRQLETQKQQETNPTESDDDKWYRAYSANPVQVLDTLNAKIGELETIDPWDEKYKEARASIAKINAFKDRLVARQRQESEIATRTSQISNQIIGEVVQAIPDFAERSEKLTEFAKSQYGFTNEELSYLTSPAMGNVAVKVIKAINQMYNVANAGKTAETKRVKTSVPKVSNEASGASAPKKTKTNFSAMSTEDFSKLANDVAMGRARIA